ncbi:MAG: type IX secretion system sortase PorU [Gilvibacter sp.]
MMKKKIALLLLWIPLIAMSQQQKIEIPWPSDSALKNDQISPETFTVATFAKASEYLFGEQWDDSNYANPTSLKISGVRYGDLTTAERGQLDEKIIPSTIQAKIGTSKARDQIITTLTVSPIVNVNGRLQKVLSFTADYSYQLQARPKGGGLPLTNSVLASGSWYKFKVDKTGVYRLSQSFLSSLGINTESINPRNIKVYGHGGEPLPFRNEDNFQFDLPELAIQVTGEEDGSFDSSDSVLFYAVGPRGFMTELNTNVNPYSDDAYYYITIGSSPGKRMAPMIEASGPPTTVITQFDDYQFYEEDDFSIVKVGRRWFGNPFEVENEQTFEFSFPNIVGGTPLEVEIFAAAASESVTTMSVAVTGGGSDTMTFGAINDIALARGSSSEISLSASSEDITVELIYNNSGNPASFAFLDYIAIRAKRQLQGVEGQLAFTYLDAATTAGVGQYTLSNASQFDQIWDVTDIHNATSLPTDGGDSVSFTANLGEARDYVAVNPADYFEPIRLNNSNVSNQDIKGSIFLNEAGVFEDIDYLIITNPIMLQPALRLANHHKTRNGLNVKVVSTDRIYQEFSSGQQDIGAIRNLVRYVYENASSLANRVKYIGFFGDTSVDYKNRLPGNNNIVPTYQAFDSFSTLSGYMSDDYFGMMDPEEGIMAGADRLDIAVGRIIADDLPLANAMVDKLIAYENKVSYGNWRNNFTLVSDDVDAVFEFATLEQSLDNLGDDIGENKPFVNVKKIHTDAFQQESSAGGNRYPRVNEEIVNAIDVGTLVMTYLGHGGEDGLAKEFIFTTNNAKDLQNTNRYPLITTVTCEFTRFDNPLRPTAGEFTYWNLNGGAIGLITTTRTIGVSLGVQFNNELAPVLFAFGSDTFETPAESLRITKNRISNVLRRVVFYVGDPAMQLAFPKQEIRLTTLNGEPLGTATDTLKALSRVRLGGEVRSESGAVLTDYNGIAQIKVFDKRVQRQTLGNDGVREDGELLILDFETLGSGIFNGQASVTNGLFEIEFVVPRDIAIPVGNGRVSLYSEKTAAFEDQTGFNEEIKVGGLDENAPEDNIGPTIQLFMNDESFVSGGITNDSPILIAKLMDEHGINTASGIGHDMIAILDGDESNPIILNDYYLADVDDFTKGTTNYRLKNLEEGLHTLTLKAWDVYNNSSTADIQFVVAGDNELRLERVLNYPNPFVNYTEFWFNHNRPFEPLEVQVQVFTVTGKVVWTKNQIITTEGFLSRDIVWDGKDDFGDRIGKGVYVYKITVKSTLTNQQVEKFEKLVIL